MKPSPAFTLDTYAHAVPALEEEAADRFAELIDRRTPFANRLHEPPGRGVDLGL